MCRDPEVEAGIDRVTMTSLKLANQALREQLGERREQIATLRYALRHVYTRVEAARGAFSDEVLELIGYRKKEV